MSTPGDGSVMRCPHCRKRNRVRAVSDGTPRCANCHQPLPWVVNTDERGFDAEVAASVPVLVDFWAPWCGPCRMLSPVVERLAGRYAGRLKLVKINVDENAQIASRYNALSIPLLVLFREGREIARQVGAVPEGQLSVWLESRLPTPTSGRSSP